MRPHPGSGEWLCPGTKSGTVAAAQGVSGVSLIVPVKGVQSWQMTDQREAGSPAESGESWETGMARLLAALNDAVGESLKSFCNCIVEAEMETQRGKELQAFRCDFDQAAGTVSPVLGGCLLYPRPSLHPQQNRKDAGRRLWGGGRLSLLGLHPAFWMNHSYTSCSRSLAVHLESCGPQQHPGAPISAAEAGIRQALSVISS